MLDVFQILIALFVLGAWLYFAMTHNEHPNRAWHDYLADDAYRRNAKQPYA